MSMMRHTCAIFLFVQNILVIYSSELILNGDFESDIDGTNWECNGCMLERDGDAYGVATADFRNCLGEDGISLGL